MPIPGVTLSINYFPHYIRANFDLLLVRVDSELRDTNVFDKRDVIRREMLQNYRNVIQGLTPVRTGRLRRSIRISYGDGSISTHVGYGPTQEIGRLGRPGKHFFTRGILLATAFNRAIISRYQAEATLDRMKNVPLSHQHGEFITTRNKLKREADNLKRLVSFRTRSRSRLPKFEFFRKNEITRLFLESNSRLALIANTVGSAARNIGPIGPSIGFSRFTSPKQMARVSKLAAAERAKFMVIPPNERRILQNIQSKAYDAIDSELFKAYGLSAPKQIKNKGIEASKTKQRKQQQTKEILKAAQPKAPRKGSSRRHR